jgi:CHAT domain-containing protein
LLSAGARASLTTLGRVDDEATAEFMEQFYYHALEKRQTKSEALRLAKLKFLRSGTKLANPAYWAAFVLNGDGLDPVPRVVSWKELAACTMAALLLILASVFLLRNRRRDNR